MQKSLLVFEFIIHSQRDVNEAVESIMTRRIYFAILWNRVEYHKIASGFMKSAQYSHYCLQSVYVDC